MSAKGEYWVQLLAPGSEVDGLRRTHDELQLPYVKQMCVSPICQKVITKSAIRQSHVSKSPIKQSGCNGSLHGGRCNPPRFLPDTMYLQHHYPVAGEILRHTSRGSSQLRSRSMRSNQRNLSPRYHCKTRLMPRVMTQCLPLPYWSSG